MMTDSPSAKFEKGEKSNDMMGQSREAFQGIFMSITIIIQTWKNNTNDVHTIPCCVDGDSAHDLRASPPRLDIVRVR